MSRDIVVFMEHWSPVIGYEGNYEVSDMGRVRNVRRDSILAPLNARGYRRVGLYLNGAMKLINVHHLVCAAFIGERPERQEINHKNGIRNDNRLENLEYCTRKANALHARRMLHRSSGENHYKCRLSTESITEIRRLAESGETQTRIGEMFGVTQAHISQIVLGRSRVSG